MASGLGSLALANPRRVADEDAPWFEATVPELRRLMRSREMSSRELTHAYLRRIEKLNPLLNAVIETNPDALGIAAERDAETASRRPPGATAWHPCPAEGQHRHR